MSVGQADEDEDRPEEDGEEAGLVEHCVGGCSDIKWVVAISLNILGHQRLMIECVCFC